MKYRISMCVIMLFAAGVSLLAHREYPSDWRQELRDADMVAVAVIETVQVQESRCSTRHVYGLRVLEMIKGVTAAGKDCVFVYSRYHPLPARWPWQEDCPAVHYRLPALARSMQQGDRLVIFGKMAAGEPVIQGVISLQELDAVRSMLDGVDR